MSALELDAPCGRYLLLRDLIEAGETWRQSRVPNIPEQTETITALHRLAAEIIDLVATEFGRPDITYGFASHALTRLIPGRIDPSRDQHAGHERKDDGNPICPRLGQAVDFQVSGVPSGRIAAWIAHRLPFDRIYFYGPERPCISALARKKSERSSQCSEVPQGGAFPEYARHSGFAISLADLVPKCRRFWRDSVRQEHRMRARALRAAVRADRQHLGRLRPSALSRICVGEAVRGEQITVAKRPHRPGQGNDMRLHLGASTPTPQPSVGPL